MRKAFVSTLVELAQNDPRILLLTADLGYSVLEPFRERFQDRFFNIGVAEQNMVGVATGLADAGFIPFLYSIAPFASLRPYELIRNGPIMHRLPVRIVGVGGGFEYSSAGHSHFGLEDIGVMRIQPGIGVIAPADYGQTRAALLATWDSPGPIYYRIGKDDKTLVDGLDGRFELGRAQIVREGRDLLMVTMGSIAAEVVSAAESLATQHVNSTVAVVASLNPAPAEDLAKLISRFSVVLTVEDHYVVGGVGSLVAEVIAEQGLGCRIVRCGVKDLPNGRSGSEAHMRSVHGLSRSRLTEIALLELKETARRLQTH